MKPARQFPATPVLLVAAIAIAVSACAGAGQLGSGAAQIETGTVGSFSPDGAYRLSSAEAKLDCRRLTGRMQVRILQIRDRLGNEPSAVYQALRDLLGAMQGSGARANEPKVDLATREDVAVLEAYNAALAAKRCPTFDLEAELQPRPIGHTPRPN